MCHCYGVNCARIASTQRARSSECRAIQKDRHSTLAANALRLTVETTAPLLAQVLAVSPSNAHLGNLVASSRRCLRCLKGKDRVTSRKAGPYLGWPSNLNNS